MPGFSNLSEALSESPIRRLLSIAEEVKSKGKKVISFSAGQPGLPPAKELVEYLASFLRKEPYKASRYSPTEGFLSLRQAISMDLEKYGGFSVQPDQILVTTGAAEGILLSFLALLNPGEQVIVCDPTYVPYLQANKIVKAKVVTWPSSVENGFQPDPEVFKELAGEKTKLVALVSPCNPTGRIISKDVLRTVLDLAEEKGFWVVFDEAYKHMVYEGEHVWAYKMDSSGSVLSINTFSKDPALAGFRIGYVYGPKEAVQRMKKIKQFTTLCTSTISQVAAEYYLTSGIKEKYLKEVLPIYARRRNELYQALSKDLPELKAFKPPAGMFIFADASYYLNQLGMDDYEFCLKLARETGVFVVPGSAFGSRGKKHLRFSFVTENGEKIREGVARIKEFILSFS